MSMRFFASTLLFVFACDIAFAVEIRTEEGERLRLHITGETYALVLNCTDAVIEKFTVGNEELIGDVPLCPTLNTGKVNGPGKVEIAHSGPALSEIHLTNLWWTDLDADIEMVLYCYRTRAFANVNVVPRGSAPDILIGWYGGTKYSMPLAMSSEEELQRMTSFNGQDPACAAVVAEPWIQLGLFGKKMRSAINFRNSIGRISGGYGYRSSFLGPRRASIILMGCRSNDALKECVRAEAARSFAKVRVHGGDFARYDGSTGYFKIERTAKDIAVGVSIVPPPSPKPATLGVRLLVASAAARINWGVNAGLVSLLAMIVFGFRARPQPGTLAARAHPKLIATMASAAFLIAVVWLFRPPPPPGPSAVPMPRGPVPAVFRVVNAPEAGFLADANGSTLPNPLQARVRPDGVTETYFEVELAPTGENSFALRDAAAPGGSAGGVVRVN